MPRKSDKLPVIPPSPRQIEAYKRWLPKCVSHEAAAVLAGIPTKLYMEWLKRGVAGEELFCDLTNALYQHMADHDRSVSDVVREAAMNGDVSSAKWLWEKVNGARQKKQDERLVAFEERMLDEPEISQESEEDLAAAEARAMKALEEQSQERH